MKPNWKPIYTCPENQDVLLYQPPRNASWASETDQNCDPPGELVMNLDLDPETWGHILAAIEIRIADINGRGTELCGLHEISLRKSAALLRKKLGLAQ